MNPSTLIRFILNYSSRLKFGNLFLLMATLFVIDLLIPDKIPFFDEIILGLITLALSKWKDPEQTKGDGNIIEGEVINKHNDRQ